MKNDIQYFIREYVYSLSNTHNWKTFKISEDFTKVFVESSCYIPFTIKLRCHNISDNYITEYHEENKLIIVK